MSEAENEFVAFPKLARLSREMIVTEKIDGSNAQVYITEDGQIKAGSRNRWITPQDDNYGFAAWVDDHHDELLTLGPGRHFGEWFGKGINRNYGLDERRFSLFNVQRWCLCWNEPQPIKTQDPRIVKMQEVLPPCCGLVPILHRGEFDTRVVDIYISDLRTSGSQAVPSFMRPEGVIVWHVAANRGFKKTLDNDQIPKSVSGA